MVAASDSIEPSTTAFLLFDLLNGHVKSGGMATTARYAPVITAAAALLTAARTQSMMVAYAHANHRADNATSATTARDTDNRLHPLDPVAASTFHPIVAGGTWAAQVIDELAPAAEDYLKAGAS